jgi:ABC-type transport system substrate-binding protein
MTILKILFAVILGIVALTIFGKVRQKVVANAPAKTAKAGNAKDPGLSAAGFFLLSRDDANNPRVTIMSAPNCPSHEAQMAEALASGLNSAGIPCELKQGIEFQFTDPADVARVNKYMASVANPLVLVRGWAKGAPSAQDVIAQYRSGN